MLDKYDVWVAAPDQGTVGPILSGRIDEATEVTDVDSEDTGYTDSGYISADGLKVSINKTFTEIKDWSQAVVRKILSEYSGEISWKHISMSEQAWKNFAGDENVTFEAAGEGHGNRATIKFNTDEPTRKSWKFKIKDGKRKLVIWVPEGQVRGDSDLDFKADGELGLPVILTTFPDKKGNHFYIFFDDGRKTGV